MVGDDMHTVHHCVINKIQINVKSPESSQSKHRVGKKWSKVEKTKGRKTVFFRKRKEPLFIYYITIGVRLFSPSNKYAMWCVFMTSHQMTWMVYGKAAPNGKRVKEKGKNSTFARSWCRVWDAVHSHSPTHTHNTSTTTAYFNGYYGCLWMMKITSYKIEKFGSYSNRSEIKWKQKDM